MIINSNKKKLNSVISLTYYLYIFAIIYIAFKHAFVMLLPFITALIISLVVEPFIVTFINKLKLKRNIAAVCCITLFYIVVIVSVYFISRITVNGITLLVEMIPQTLKNLEDALANIQININNSNSDNLKRILSVSVEYLKSVSITEVLAGSFGSKILLPVSTFLKSIPSYFLCCIISVIATYFISFSLPSIKIGIISKLNDKNRIILSKGKRTFVQIIKKYLKAYLMLMGMTFVELAVLFWIFKINPPIVLALIISVVDIMPVFGVGTVLIPWSIISLLLGNTAKAIVLLAIYFLITVVRQIAEPKIIGSSIGMNPLITLISIYFGFKLFGLFGVITVPIIVLLITKLHQSDIIKI